MSDPDHVYPLTSYQVEADPFYPYTERHAVSNVTLIIDNGSYQCKAGWAFDENPCLIFRNLVAKYRGKKENEAHVGNDIKNIEAVRWLLKTQFDKNIVTQFDVQETVFDHIFHHLGINTHEKVDHPIILTEAPCNPNYSRQNMSELLFECYNVPQVAYGVDSLFSFYGYNTKPKGLYGIVVSLGYHTTHVLPVVRSKFDPRHAKRINIGTSHMINFLQRLLQLKYPAHASMITLSRAEILLQEHMRFSQYFMDDIRLWEKEEYFKSNSHIVQLPYVSMLIMNAFGKYIYWYLETYYTVAFDNVQNPPFIPLPGSSSSNVGKMEKCQTLLKRVQAMRLKQRAEKLAFDEERLQEYLTVQELLEEGDDEAVLALQELGYTSATELQAGIKKLNCNIRKIKNLIASQQDEPQDSPLKNWCEELDLKNFTDVDAWINDVKQKRKEVSEARQKLSSDRLKSTHIGGFSSTTSNDLFGGIFADPAEKQSFEEYTKEMEEKKDQIKILDEIITEYHREFSKSETNFSFNLAEYYQLQLGVERIRVPEIVFQPTIIGVEQAGIGEVIETVLARYNANDQQKLAENIFITGGGAMIPGIKERIEAEVLAMRPFESKFNVQLAENPVTDAWKGARKWSLVDDNLKKYSISRSDYQEKGGDYLKEHTCSNHYVAINSPVKKSPVSATNMLQKIEIKS